MTKPVGENEYEDDDEEIFLDAELHNADWTKQEWDLPKTLPQVRAQVPDATKLLDKPSGKDMPRRVRSGLEVERADQTSKGRRKKSATLGPIKGKDRYRG